MNTLLTKVRRTSSVAFMLALAMVSGACGGGAGGAATQSGAGDNQAGSTAAANNGAGPDLSQLGAIVLGKINQHMIPAEAKVTGKLVDFQIRSADTKAYEGMGAESVVECAGTVVFDGDVEWNWKDSAPKKAGEPANFECRAEYHNQGQGWQLTPPMGIYPL